MKSKLVVIFLSCLLFVGCSSNKTNITAAQMPIYNSDYQPEDDHKITLEEVKKELTKSAVELETYEWDEELGLQEYNFQIDKMQVTIWTKRMEENKEEVLKSMHLRADEPQGAKISQTSFFKSLVALINEPQLRGWGEALEEKYEELKLKEVLEDSERVEDVIVAGRTYLSFVGAPVYGYKELNIVFGDWQDIPEELRGIVAELENQELYTVDYSQGKNGGMVKLESRHYHMINNGRYTFVDWDLEDLIEAEDVVGYKIMYDLTKKNKYSAQLYGFMAIESNDAVNIQDMLGIDAISSVLDMNWDDFNEVTYVINQELMKAKNLEDERQYNAEGTVAGYSYEIYVEWNKFTVLLEKI